MKSGVTFQPDNRDQNYQFHAHYGALPALDIPDNFVWGDEVLPDQKADNAETECSGYAQSENEGDVLGERCSPDFSYAAGLEAEGAVPNTGGCDFRASLQGVINRGVLFSKDAPFTAKDKGELYVADIGNWRDVAPKALPNAEASYRWVTNGPHDIFDNIRSSSFIAKKGISAASPFFPEWVGVDVVPEPDWNGSYSLHNWSIKGSTTVFLDGPKKGQSIRNGELFIPAKTWQGRWQYFDRPTINRLFTLPNAGAAIVSPDGNRLWSIVCWLAAHFPSLLFYLPKLWAIVNTPVAPYTPPTTTVEPEPTPPTPPAPVASQTSKYDWSTPELARHSLRVICDEEGLTVEQKNLMSQVVHCESGYHPDAKHPNLLSGKVVSTDFGICQWNDYYHSKEISPSDAQHDPEKAVRLMCRYVRQGRITQWVCYSSGLYRKYEP